MNKFQLWHDQLWQLRKDIGTPAHAIPGPEEALAWAVVHAARALEKHMEQGDEYREWAQCAMMLMLALGEGYEWDDSLPAIVPPLDAGALVYAVSGLHMTGTKDEIQVIAEAIDIYCVGLDMHMQQEFQRLRGKWMPEGGA